jgi:branched-chain amino acid transport system permease protein
MYGVIVGGILLASFDRILADRITTWIHSAGHAVGSPLLLAIDLTNARQFVFGLALVLLMLFRPEGIFPSRRRAAEWHEAEEEIPPESPAPEHAAAAVSSVSGPAAER